MVEIKRHSPVRFAVTPERSEERDQWQVVLAYAAEGEGPWLVDLAHIPRWDFQDSAVGDHTPWDMAIPNTPGQCALANHILINRMNRTQAAIWHLGAGAVPPPEAPGYTEVTDATVLLALFGPHTFLIAEKLTALDFFADPARSTPFLLQGPVCHVPSQVVTLAKAPDHSGGLLFTCSRGYAASMVRAVLDAGAEFGLRPAGEERFTNWLQTLQAP